MQKSNSDQEMVRIIIALPQKNHPRMRDKVGCRDEFDCNLQFAKSFGNLNIIRNIMGKHQRVITDGEINRIKLVSFEIHGCRQCTNYQRKTSKDERQNLVQR